jgi:hypothetical protein
MADAHTGSPNRASQRLRVLISLCELEQAGTPATYRLVQDRLGMSTGSIVHHIKQLRAEGLLADTDTTGALELTALAFSRLIADNWLTPARPVVAYELSTAAIEVLEVAPDTLPDDAD